jgi:nucleotide-binding universal stress UspA family protein
MKILIPVDGSTHSISAVKHFIEHAAWFRDLSLVDLLCVQPPLPTRLVHTALSAQELESYYQEEGRRALAAAQATLAEAGVAHAPHTVVGEAAESIVDQGNKLGADLILMATRGGGPASGPAFGSTTTRVLHLSTRIPVLVVHAGTS